MLNVSPIKMVESGGCITNELAIINLIILCASFYGDLHKEICYNIIFVCGSQYISMCFVMTTMKTCVIIFIYSELFSWPLPTPCIGIKVTELSLGEYTNLKFIVYELLV